MRARPPLLAEWACLGALYGAPSHGFALSKRLAGDGDLGRIWHVSRPLTYRALDQLRSWGWIEARGEECGAAGPTRTLLAATDEGRSQFTTWLTIPVTHLRDVRTELLLKVVLADEHQIDIATLLEQQKLIVDTQANALDTTSDGGTDGPGGPDVVACWRHEMTLATQRFVGELCERAR